MSVGLHIVEHKDCLRCFQPIDERAELCPFCNSSQKVRRRWWRSLIPWALVAIAASVFWYAFSDLRNSKAGLEHEVSQRQEALAATIHEIEAQELAAASAFQASLIAANNELDGLVRQAEEYSENIAKFCRGASILQVCDSVLTDSAENSLAMAKIFGRYQAFGNQSEFCDRIRPVLVKLASYSETEFGRAIYDRYFQSTEACWR